MLWLLKKKADKEDTSKDTDKVSPEDCERASECIENAILEIDKNIEEKRRARTAVQRISRAVAELRFDASGLKKV